MSGFMRATPKLSSQQRRVINNDDVKLLGFDMANRPVIEYWAGIPKQLRRTALTRQGDAIDIVEPIRAVRSAS